MQLAIAPPAAPAAEPTPPATILVVDDESTVRRAVTRVLERAGHRVIQAECATTALTRVGEGGIDVVISDVHMPEMTGVDLLRALHEHDEELPVVLLTGFPTMESALEAVELHALRYLRKPVDVAELEEAVREALRTREEAERRRHGLTLLAEADEAEAARLSMSETFDRALEALWIAFQPIVSPAERKVIGFEALMRSDEPAMPHPGALLDAAESLGRVCELGRTVRARVVARLPELPRNALVFVNLHPLDLKDASLYDPEAPLSRHAHRVVLEITERSAIDRDTKIEDCLTTLELLGFRIAVDDLGAGYASLSALVSLRPHVVKIDMSLVRDVDTDLAKHKLAAAIVSVARELGITVVAEGIETAAERDVLVAAGSDLLQGFFFAKPSRELPPINWD